MPFWLRLTGVPLILVGAGLVVSWFQYPDLQGGGACVALAFFWVYFTGRARRTYWTTRLRVRAANDERRAKLTSH